MELQGSYKLNWNRHGLHLHSSISKLYNTDNFTDVVLATADGQYIPAHQFVLSACSSYLHKMFRVAQKSSKMFAKMFIVLPSDISYTTLSVLLQYIYRGEVIVNHDQLPNVMKAASILQIVGLCPVEEKPNENSTASSTDQHNKSTDQNNKSTDQHNKTGSDLKKDSVKIQLNRQILIPEVRKAISVNAINFNKTPASAASANELPRINSPNDPPPARKKLKGNPNESSSESDNRSNERGKVTVEIKEEQEIQVKDEPDWEDQKSTDGDDSIIKEEAVSEEEIEVEGDDCYVPLTCDLCKKTFTTPALWVQHIQQKHPSTALASGKRGDALDADNSTGFPPLHCEMCKKVFTVPADWVKHIQSHTEEQLTENNDKVAGRKFQCKVCSKTDNTAVEERKISR
ncbi:protein tramtrack, beta isoform-like isoform X2 [Homalodisca vitripennis]|uniref:protein tramtrack, beta isoform-like isoform X2 n=1 Tax=Homalodisca vitripennis TaxID=197043 RepID=UPI001EEACB9A|nr:protein tramtrack, beta isoform-like isoform X2 [Homalodisca vitripennis]